MPHIILNITHISKKHYYFLTNLFKFMVNFNMIYAQVMWAPWRPLAAPSTAAN